MHKSPLAFFNSEHSQSKASPVIFADNAGSTGINNCSLTINGLHHRLEKGAAKISWSATGLINQHVKLVKSFVPFS